MPYNKEIVLDHKKRLDCYFRELSEYIGVDIPVSENHGGFNTSLTDLNAVDQLRKLSEEKRIAYVVLRLVKLSVGYYIDQLLEEKDDKSRKIVMNLLYEVVVPVRTTIITVKSILLLNTLTAEDGRRKEMSSLLNILSDNYGPGFSIDSLRHDLSHELIPDVRADR